MTHFLMRDEKKEAEIIIKQGFENGYSYGEALSVAKYYRHVNGWKQNKIKIELLAFIKKYDPFFNEIINSDTIDDIIRNSKRPFTNKSKVLQIRKNEIDVIKQIKNFRLQKIAVALLLVAKRDGEKGNVALSLWADVKRASCVKPTDAEIFECLRVLYHMGHVKFPMSVPRRPKSDGYHTLLFIDNKSPVAIEIKSESDFLKAGNIYRDYRGGEIRFCANCSDELQSKSNNTRYCEKCSQDRKREVWRKNSKKYYENKFS